MARPRKTLAATTTAATTVRAMGTTTPNTFWVDFADLDFSEGAEPKKLAIAGGHYYSGNAAEHFEAATPFEFMSAEGQK